MSEKSSKYILQNVKRSKMSLFNAWHCESFQGYCYPIHQAKVFTEEELSLFMQTAKESDFIAVKLEGAIVERAIEELKAEIFVNQEDISFYQKKLQKAQETIIQSELQIENYKQLISK